MHGWKPDQNKCSHTWISRAQGFMHDNQCSNKVVTDIDGKNYCAFHNPNKAIKQARPDNITVGELMKRLEKFSTASELNFRWIYLKSNIIGFEVYDIETSKRILFDKQGSIHTDFGEEI